MFPLSVLDLAPVADGSDIASSFRASVSLAQHAEALGYRRYWLAEHHNMPAIASSATAVLIGHIAGRTQRIRVGAGGIMLPNHAPLQVAEQFGTLATLTPGRIDLGLGRAPGTDTATARALRRYFDSADQFPHDVQELLAYFEPATANQAVRAIPGEGVEVDVWLLGSSLFSARLAARLGLPFAFASHFAPDALGAALRVYREGFQPSKRLAKPYAIAGINVVAGESDSEARRQFTTVQQSFTNLRRGVIGLLPQPIDDIENWWTPLEKAGVEHALACSVVGNPDSVAAGLDAFVERHRPDELIVVSNLYSLEARTQSLSAAAEWAVSRSG
ncbi:LLM class flavin-dependent oxidoreductase [Pseudofulvimonas gallinarii]|uniref:Luciferase-like monooxygenase n=1 Tax=Pseudofulvimonas gallinarii TaxID=634155 RepID=A0A4S3KZW7_9GAMM|nr:LLM class flavin-dependent oxidoreductase [Pseudofulvimonas gallinarii]TCT01211.1 luciferase family oxidoreductase group 1 [Pseudofulvimonas gallinarii]THD14977.1 luciferase family oxidoreductase [Pseudofulvimonas gallinarii]